MEVKNMDQLIGIREAATRLGTCTATLRQWDNEGKLVAVKTVGGHRRYRNSDLDKFLGNSSPTNLSLFDEVELTAWLRGDPIPPAWKDIFISEIAKVKQLSGFEVEVGKYLSTFGTPLTLRVKLIDARNALALLQTSVDSTTLKYAVASRKLQVSA
jgi:excisionase family DNA binding protein